MLTKAFRYIGLGYFALAGLTFGQEESIPSQEATAPEAVDLGLGLNWTTEGSGRIGSQASIEIPAGYRFVSGADAAKLMEEFGNLPDKYDGLIAVDDLDWFVIFQFEDSGYVEDSDKDDLDADALLDALKESDKPSNDQRKRMGLGVLNTVGWAVEPNYNADTNNLEWGLILEDGEGIQTVNYLTKILGRRGIMHTTLVCDPEDLNAVLPVYQDLLNGYSYNQGQTYAEYQDGDKVAEYGLKALIAGGAIYGAAKLGLIGTIVAFFKKGFKFIIIGVIAVGAWMKRFITGKRAES